MRAVTRGLIQRMAANQHQVYSSDVTVFEWVTLFLLFIVNRDFKSTFDSFFHENLKNRIQRKCSESPPAASPSPPQRTWTPSRPFSSTRFFFLFSNFSKTYFFFIHRSASTLPSLLPPAVQLALVLTFRYGINIWETWFYNLMSLEYFLRILIFSKHREIFREVCMQLWFTVICRNKTSLLTPE